MIFGNETCVSADESINSEEKLRHDEMANAVRFLSMDAVQAANSGHPGMPMGMADVATVLFSQFLKFDASTPEWADRDRFVLSAGHGSMLLYSLLHLTGYEKMSLDQIKNFRQLGSLCAGHPEVDHAAGIEMTTGPLGQGFGHAVGMALAEKMMAARFGEDVVDHHTYVIASDGDLQEGISHEAASLAGHLGLSKLIVLYDDNKIQIDGSTDLSFTEDVTARFHAYGWETQTINGHDPDRIARAIAWAQTTDAPSLIACKTTIGYGAPTKAGTASTHGSPLGDDEIKGAREKLGWPHPAFEVPDHIMQNWREAGSRGAEARQAWEQRLQGLPKDVKAEFDRLLEGRLPGDLADKLQVLKEKIVAEKPKLATRKASGTVLDVLVPNCPEMIGGSADLTGSVNTLVGDMGSVSKDDFAARYIHYGVREHAMGTVMGGMALHGELIPYSGTFLCFADYCRPSIRLAALMKKRVVYVMTHDSIGLGEDGPTHQPIEHLASLRAMPNCQVFRPADTIEAAECWQLALENKTGPSIMVLTRQGLPTVRSDISENLTAKGGYVLADSEGDRQITLLATGSEVSIALQAKELLAKKGVQAAVVSMPCWELFEAQDESYRAHVLGSEPRIAIEAAARLGWDRWIGEQGSFIGMESFGESAPAPELYEHFGITAEAVCDVALKRV